MRVPGAIWILTRMVNRFRKLMIRPVIVTVEYRLDGSLCESVCVCELIQHNNIIVNVPHLCNRRLLWRRWCNKWECRWGSFRNLRSFVTAAPLCASCEHRQQRSSRRWGKRRRRFRNRTRSTTRTKPKESVQRRPVSEAARGTLAVDWRSILSCLSPPPQRTAAFCGNYKLMFEWVRRTHMIRMTRLIRWRQM